MEVLYSLEISKISGVHIIVNDCISEIKTEFSKLKSEYFRIKHYYKPKIHLAITFNECNGERIYMLYVILSRQSSPINVIKTRTNLKLCVEIVRRIYNRLTGEDYYT